VRQTDEGNTHLAAAAVESCRRGRGPLVAVGQSSERQRRRTRELCRSLVSKLDQTLRLIA
jgi:hypothetical protein